MILGALGFCVAVSKKLRKVRGCWDSGQTGYSSSDLNNKLHFSFLTQPGCYYFKNISNKDQVYFIG